MTLKFETFHYPKDLTDFVRENQLKQDQIAGISISYGKQILYYWSRLI